MSRTLLGKTVLAGILVCALWVPGGAQHVPAQHTLDLTSPNVIKTMPAVVGGVGVARSGQPAPSALPFRLRVIQLDRALYELGSRIVYEIELTNSGTQPIGLPWSSDLELIERPGQSFITSFLSLSVSARPGQEYRIGAVILGGSSTVRDSIETIRPGEVGVIKVASAIIPPPDFELTAIPFTAQAVYQLSGGGVVKWQELRSINTVPIALQRPQ